jgi:hypothetical protein
MKEIPKAAALTDFAPDIALPSLQIPTTQQVEIAATKMRDVMILSSK